MFWPVGQPSGLASPFPSYSFVLPSRPYYTTASERKGRASLSHSSFPLPPSPGRLTSRNETQAPSPPPPPSFHSFMFYIFSDLPSARHITGWLQIREKSPKWWQLLWNYFTCWYHAITKVFDRRKRVLLVNFKSPLLVFENWWIFWWWSKIIPWLLRILIRAIRAFSSSFKKILLNDDDSDRQSRYSKSEKNLCWKFLEKKRKIPHAQFLPLQKTRDP